MLAGRTAGRCETAYGTRDDCFVMHQLNPGNDPAPRHRPCRTGSRTTDQRPVAPRRNAVLALLQGSAHTSVIAGAGSGGRDRRAGRYRAT